MSNRRVHGKQSANVTCPSSHKDSSELQGGTQQRERMTTATTRSLSEACLVLDIPHSGHGADGVSHALKMSKVGLGAMKQWLQGKQP